MYMFNTAVDTAVVACEWVSGHHNSETRSIHSNNMLLSVGKSRVSEL